MKLSEMQVGAEYALGSGDIRDLRRFRHVVYVRRAKPRYDEWNRTRVLNRGHCVFRYLDEPQTEPDPFHRKGRRNVSFYGGDKGAEIEVDVVKVSWTWADFESKVADQLEDQRREEAQRKEITDFLLELGIPEERWNLGRHSLYGRFHQGSVDIMYGDDNPNVQLPWRVFKKLVAGAELTDADWGDS